MNNQIKTVVSLYSGSIKNKKLILDSNGIVGDKHYAKNQNRSVLITSIHSYVIARDKGIKLNYGDLGENILVDFNPYTLESGVRVSIGNDVVLEISQNSTLCKSLSKLDSRLPKLLKNDRGIFAKVIKEGDIKEGDIINIIQ